MYSKKEKKGAQKKLQFSTDQSTSAESVPSAKSSRTATTSERIINYSNPIALTKGFNNSNRLNLSLSPRTQQNIALYSDASRINAESTSLQSLLNTILQKQSAPRKKNVIIILYNLLVIFKADINYTKELLIFIDNKLNISTQNTFQKINTNVKNLLWEFNKKQTQYEFDQIIYVYIAYSLIDFPVPTENIASSLQRALNIFEDKKKIIYRTKKDIDLNIQNLCSKRRN
jgi:hypothetical protein